MFMQNNSYRHEWKHFMSYSDYLAIRSRLMRIASRDAHANRDGRYQIRSLYFDNADNKALLEKLTGVDHREKFRLRMYNDDQKFIRLEKKIKVKNLCQKLSVPIDYEHCLQLLKGKTEWMMQSGQALLVELYSKMKFQQLRPKTLVDYVREPFVFQPGNVRITFDSQIRTGLSSADFFNPNVPTVASTPGTVIMEIKYDSFIPEIICDLLQTGDRSHNSFSKYAACRIYG